MKREWEKIRVRGVHKMKYFKGKAIYNGRVKRKLGVSFIANPSNGKWQTPARSNNFARFHLRNNISDFTLGF